MNSINLGFIGIGKIATAVIEGLCTSEMKRAIVRISPRNQQNSEHLAAMFTNVFKMQSNQEVVDHSDIAFLAVRPTQAEEILTGLKFRPDHTIVSLIPLLKYSDIARIVRPATKICRAIPLPPVVNHNCPIPVFNASQTVVDILSNLGQPLLVPDENQLHALWTLTCLITPYYDLLNELSEWTRLHGVNKEIADQYIANLFEALSYTAKIADPIEFNDLARHAATPNGMNEQAGRDIRESGAHEAYREAADHILQRFPKVTEE
jgi:pyrroline-5-carboxylate reductase